MSLSFPSVFTAIVLIIGLPVKCRAAESASRQARLHPSYQVFAAQTRLPEIKALDNDVILVGGNLKLGFQSSYRLMGQDKAALAQLLQIPMELLTAIVHKMSAKRLGGEDLAGQFRTAVIDYKYLAQRWADYRPSAGGSSVKAEALKCLETGDLEKAWQMFIDLPKPSPPVGFHIASAPGGKN